MITAMTAQTIFDFNKNSDVQDWKIVDDGVMEHENSLFLSVLIDTCQPFLKFLDDRNSNHFLITNKTLNFVAITFILNKQVQVCLVCLLFFCFLL